MARKHALGSYFNPIVSTDVPIEYIINYFCGVGRMGHFDIYNRGKQDVYDAYVNTGGDKAQIVKALKSWKGIGGSGVPGKEGFQSEVHDSRGVNFRWVIDGLVYSGLVGWTDIVELLIPHIKSYAFFIPPKDYIPGCVPDRLWEEPLESFFSCGLSTERGILLKEVILGEYTTSSKVEFLKAFFFGMSNHKELWFYYPCFCKNTYGSCDIDAVRDGIIVQFFDENSVKWKKHLDWRECLVFLIYRFRQGVYQAEGIDYLESALSKAPWCSRVFMGKYGWSFLNESCEERVLKRLELVNKVIKDTSCKASWNYESDVLEIYAGTDIYSGKDAYEYLVGRFFTKEKYGVRCEWLNYAEVQLFQFYRTASL